MGESAFAETICEVITKVRARGNSSLKKASDDVGREMEGIDKRDRADPETSGHWDF